MAVAFVQEFKTLGSDRTTKNYDHIVKRVDIDSNPPPGLIAQIAGWDKKAGVFRIVGIWQSADELESFMRDRLAPAFAEGPVNNERTEEPDLDSIYELHHLLEARQTARSTSTSRAR